MSVRNDYPEGIYYWGQNRLGSFLPEVTSVFIKIFHVHPLTAISMVNHLFLLTLFYLLQNTLKNKLHKIVLALLLFFPLYTFNALLLIGHPYCSQMVVGSLAVFLIHRVYLKLIEQKNIRSFSIWWMGLTSAFLFGISIWISESSILFPLFCFIYFLLETEKRKSFFSILRENKSTSFIFFGSILVIGIFWILKIKQFKNYYPSNDLYDQIFISEGSEIQQQTKWMWQKFSETISFQNESSSTSWLLWVSITLLIFGILSLIKNRNAFSSALFLTLLSGFLALFFSTWNYRSQFEPRYFTILYPFLFIWIMHRLEESYYLSRKFVWIPATIIGLLTLSNNSGFILERKPGVVERFSGFAELAPGGMIGNYWQVYRACAISPFHLKGIAMQGDPLRNEHMLKEVMEEKIIYVIKTDFPGMEKEMPDTLVQYGYTLVKTSTEEKEIGYVQVGTYQIIGK